jgi:hypothetical protein
MDDVHFRPVMEPDASQKRCFFFFLAKKKKNSSYPLVLFNPKQILHIEVAELSVGCCFSSERSLFLLSKQSLHEPTTKFWPACEINGFGGNSFSNTTHTVMGCCRMTENMSWHNSYTAQINGRKSLRAQRSRHITADTSIQKTPHGTMKPPKIRSCFY